ncbi:MAG: permease [Clostridia bacterium]|nr:permease [Clostridia bacterium]
MSLFGGALSVKGVTFLIFSVFVIAAAGYGLGRIKIKGVSLGTAGVFIIALLYGCFFFNTLAAELSVKSGEVSLTYVSNGLKTIENIGLIMFVTAVGFIAGPGFFHNLKKHFKSYVILSLVLVLTGGTVCAVCILIGKNFSTLDSKEFTAMLVGILSGALTSTPAFSAAKATVTGISPQLEDLVTVGHGIAYLFGIIGIVLFIQIIPKILKADMEKERAILAADIAFKKTDDTKKKNYVQLDGFSFLPFCAAAVLGMIIGSFKVRNFSLTITGGCLLVSLLLGHFGHIGKVSIVPSDRTLKVLRELGLMLFLIGAGVAGGANFVKYFNWIYFVYGMILTIIPLITGFIFAKYVLKMKLLDSLGAISGGRTSTPALGALINTAGTEDVASAYAAAYPVALVMVVIVSEVLILIFGS